MEFAIAESKRIKKEMDQKRYNQQTPPAQQNNTQGQQHQQGNRYQSSHQNQGQNQQRSGSQNNTQQYPQQNNQQNQTRETGRQNYPKQKPFENPSNPRNNPQNQGNYNRPQNQSNERQDTQMRQQRPYPQQRQERPQRQTEQRQYQNNNQRAFNNNSNKPYPNQGRREQHFQNSRYDNRQNQHNEVSQQGRDARYNKNRNDAQYPNPNKVYNDNPRYQKPTSYYNKNLNITTKPSYPNKQHIANRFQVDKAPSMVEQEEEEEVEGEIEGQAEEYEDEGEGEYEDEEYEEEEGNEEKQGEEEYDDGDYDEGAEGEEEEQEEEEQEQEEPEPEKTTRNLAISKPIQAEKSQSMDIDAKEYARIQSKGGYIPLRLKKHKLMKNKEVSMKKQFAETMCPMEQFKSREQIFRNNNKGQDTRLRLDLEQWFSFYEIDKKTNLPTIDLCIKRFARSTGLESVIRTPKTLKRTMDYILKYIVDSDKKPLDTLPFIGPVDSQPIKYHDIYNFLWNRLRAMIIDITEMPQEMNESKESISCLEMIARFYFLSINERRKGKHQEHIDEKINKDRISQTLSGLINFYKHSRSRLKALIVRLKSEKGELTNEGILKEMEKENIYVSPNEPEILSYTLIFEKNLSRLETFHDDFKEFQFNPLIESPEIQLSMEIESSLSANNYEKFFSLLESDRTNYLTGSCVLNEIFNVRCSMLQAIHDNWRSLEVVDGVNAISLQLLDKYLRFKGDKAELIEFIQHVQGTIDSKQNYLLKKGFGKLVQGYVPPFYKFQNNKLRRQLYGLTANKSGTVSRQQLIGGSWKSNNYLTTLIDLFKNKEVVFVPKNLSNLKNPSLALNQEKSLDVSEKDMGEKKFQEKSDQGSMDEETKLFLRVKRKKAMKSLETETLNLFLEKIKKSSELKQTIEQKLIKSIIMIEMKPKRVGFEKLKNLVKEKTLKKQAFEAIRHCKINHEIWKTYIPLQVPSKKSLATNPLTEGGQLEPPLPFLLLRQQQFQSHLVQNILQYQKPSLKVQPVVNFRILFLINKPYFSNKFRTNYIKQLIKYLQSQDNTEWYDSFVRVGGSNLTTFNKEITFQFEDDQRKLNFAIDCVGVELEGEKRRLKGVIEKEGFGADLIVIPLINEGDSGRVLDSVCQQIRESELDSSKLHFLIPTVQSQSLSAISPPSEPSDSIPDCVNRYEIDLVINPINPTSIAHFMNITVKALDNKPTLPSLTYVSLAFQLGTIFKNMEYVEDQIKDTTLQYYYYQLYIEECLNQLIEATQLIYSNKEIILDWRNIIGNLVKINHRDMGVRNTKSISVSTLSNTEESSVLHLLQALKIKLVDRNYFMQNKKKEGLLKRSLKYLSQFMDKEGLEVYQKRLYYYIQNDLGFTSGQLPEKNIKTIFDNLLYGVVNQLQENDVYLLLPTKFEFAITSKSFQDDVLSRHKKILDQLNFKPSKVDSETFMNMIKKRNGNEQKKGKFVYEHQNWVEFVQKRRKIDLSTG